MDLLFEFFLAFLVFLVLYIFIFIATNIREICLYDRMMIRLMDISKSITLNLLAKYEGYRQYLLLTIIHRCEGNILFSMHFLFFKQFTINISYVTETVYL